MKTSQITFREFIPKSKERTYYELPFEVPENVCRIDIEYAYPRHREEPGADGVTLRREVNIVDLALRDAHGGYVGASGSDRSHIYISAWESAQGYARTDTDPGRWAVIVGAYKIEDAGVEVIYTVTFTYRERMLLRGDTHMHTLGSDGCMSVRDTALTARDLGLDYIFITDHNNYAHNLSSPDVEGITVLPGTEWTHYDGHAGLLGVARPFGSAFCVNSKEEAWAKLAEARANGAVVVLNHPFCPFCGWHFGMDEGGYDVIELVNGGAVADASEKCLAWWHEQLCRGAKLPVIGGSDFHRPRPYGQIGLPTTALYAMSRAPRDILAAVKGGNGYLTMDRDAPTLWAEAGGAILGETAPQGAPTAIRFDRLRGGDVIRILTDRSAEEIACAPDTSRVELTRDFPDARFVRFELLRCGRTFLISNPIYFS